MTDNLRKMIVHDKSETISNSAITSCTTKLASSIK